MDCKYQINLAIKGAMASSTDRLSSNFNRETKSLIRERLNANGNIRPRNCSGYQAFP